MKIFSLSLHPVYRPALSLSFLVTLESEFDVRHAWSRLLHVNHKLRPVEEQALSTSKSDAYNIGKCRYRMTASHARVTERRRKAKRQKRERKKHSLSLNPDGFEDEEAKSGFKVVLGSFFGTNQVKSALVVVGRDAGFGSPNRDHPDEIGTVGKSGASVVLLYCFTCLCPEEGVYVVWDSWRQVIKEMLQRRNETQTKDEAK